MKLKLILVFATISALLHSCDRDPKPYQSKILNFYKDKLKIEIMLESVHIDTLLNKDDMQSILQERLNNYRKANLEMSQYNYKRAVEDYEFHKRTSDALIVNTIYKPKVDDAKKKLDDAKKEVFSDDMVAKYEALIREPPIVEQFTIRYRTHDGGGINIQKFESEILNNDTTIRAIK